MAMQHAYQWYTFEQYLKTEEQYPDRKFEYIQGQIREMAGGTFEHARIALNLANKIDTYLGDGLCQVIHSDIHVFPLGGKDPSYLPDVTVTCTPSDYQRDSKAIRFPYFIVEVLSPTTTHIDEGEKLRNYQACESMQEYLLVSSMQWKIQAYRRGVDHKWYKTLSIGEEIIPLQSIGLTMPMSEIYRRTGIPPFD